MMTFDQFITKYTGKFVEYHSYDPAAKNQCVDLVNAYITEVLGLPAIIGTNAQDFPSKRGNNYEWVVNTPNGLPFKGDLMIFKSADKVGHISIFIEGNLTSFKSFDQNFPTGSPCQIVTHKYTNVLGWLHPRKATMTTYKGYDLDNKDSMKIAVDVLVRVQNGEFIDKTIYEEITSDLATERQKTLSLQKERSSLQESLAIKSRDLEEALEKISDLESQPTVPVDPDMDKWELNGLIVVEGNKRYNYKLKE